MSQLNIRPEKVLVVLPALNEARHIEACLRSLIGADDWMKQVKIVVVDGGSSDDTRDRVLDLSRLHRNLRLLDNPQRLQSAGLNLAVEREATPEHSILVRCDVHSIYPPGFVRNVAQSLAQNQAASVVVPMDALGDGQFQRAAAWVADTVLGSGGSAHRGGVRSGWVDHGHHAGFDLAWFRRLGGYDSGFSHNEDAEYDLRLAQAGGRIWMDADIRIGYLMRTSVLTLARQYWNYGRGRARTVLKHHARPKLRQLVPLVNLILLLVSLAAVPFTLAGLIWPFAYGALLVSAGLWGAITIGPSGALAGLALAAMHLPWGAGFLATLRRAFVAAPVAATQPRATQNV